MNFSEIDKQNIWHPFTQHQIAVDQLCIVSADGCYLEDEQGNRYLDAISSWWTNLFGHRHPYITQSIKNQLNTLDHVLFAGFTHPAAVELSQKLLKILPSNQAKLFFSDNGSTAVEVALKMAFQYWYNKGMPKTRIVAFKHAYHGDTFGAMSVGARGVFNRPFESLFFEVDTIDLPNEDNIETLLSEYEQILSRGDVAAFIFEPLVLGSAGMKMYNASHLDELLSVAAKYDVLCIADEVMTGFGRTGKHFATDYLNHKPDMLCMSKGITGGFMPLGVTSCTMEIYAAFLSTDKLKTFFHGHSYTAYSLACAAASATMDVLEKEWQMVEQLCKWQAAHVLQLVNHNRVAQIRQTGTIVAFEIKSGNKADYFNEIRDKFYSEILKRGVLLRPLGNTVYIMPPYTINREELQFVYNQINEVLEML